MYEISFIEHSVPDCTVSTTTMSKLFFVHDGALQVYNLSTTKITRVASVPGAHTIFVLGRLVCLVAGNILFRFRMTEESALLEDKLELHGTPDRTVAQADGVIFVHADCFEIFKGNSECRTISYRMALPAAMRTARAVDVQCCGDHSYLLFDNGRIARCKNILVAEMVSALSWMVYVPEYEDLPFTGITIENGILNAVNKKHVCRYRVHDLILVQEYMLDAQGTLMGDLLCGEDTVVLAGAPFKCLADRLYSYSNKMGISASRVYFFTEQKPASERRRVEATYAPLPVQDVSVNVDSFTCPSYITDERIANAYKMLLAKIKQQEIIANRIKELRCGFAQREKELADSRRVIEAQARQAEEQCLHLKDRIAAIKERAAHVAPDSDVSLFDRNVDTLRKLLDAYDPKVFAKEKQRLKMQNVVLKSKLALQRK